MTLKIGVLTTRTGGTGSNFAASLGVATAENKMRTLIIDGDSEGGNLDQILGIDTQDNSIEFLYSDDMSRRHVSSASLQSQAVAYPGNSYLSLVPGFQENCGPRTSELFSYFEDAINGLNHDVVIIDFGAPLSFPELVNIKLEGDTITHLCDRIFVVIRDDVPTAIRAIETLRAAQLTKFDLVVCQQRDSNLTTLMAKTLQSMIGDFPFHTNWQWDNRREDVGFGETLKPSLIRNPLELLGLVTKS